MLGVVRVLLVVVITTLLVQSLAVRVALGLDCHTDVCAGLLSGGARGGVGPRGARLEHGRVLHIWLRDVTRAVWSTIILILWVGVVIVWNGRRWELLWTLTTSRLRLTSVLR